MAKKWRRGIRVRIPLESLPESLQEHLRTLGMDDVETYLAWCRGQGFASHWRKGAAELAAERASRQPQGVGRVAEVRRLRRPRQKLRRLLQGARTDSNTTDGLARVAAFFDDPRRTPVQHDFAGCGGEAWPRAPSTSHAAAHEARRRHRV